MSVVIEEENFKPAFLKPPLIVLAEMITIDRNPFASVSLCQFDDLNRIRRSPGLPRNVRQLRRLRDAPTHCSGAVCCGKNNAPSDVLPCLPESQTTHHVASSDRYARVCPK